MAQKPGGSAVGTFQFGWFSNLSGLALALSAVLYLLGWFYLYGYYKVLGLALSELDWDPREVVIAGLTAALPAIGYCCLILAGTGVIVLDRHLRRPDRERSLMAAFGMRRPFETGAPLWSFRLAVGLVALLGVYPLSLFAAGRGSAQSAILERNPGCDWPQVHVFSKKEKLPADISDSAPQDPEDRVISGRLLTHGKKGYYLYSPVDWTKVDGLRKLGLPANALLARVDFIPDADILETRIEPCLQ